MKDDLHALICQMKNHSKIALSRLISITEKEPDRRKDILSLLLPIETSPFILGITGPPGAGKSTLIDRLIHYLKKEYNKIFVLAIDPASRHTGGAFLGDRIRMKTHFLDDNIFIRSLSDQWLEKGLASIIYDLIYIIAVAQYDLIIIETVGTGQSETEISNTVDMTVAVTTPFHGDNIQYCKAGLFEVSDIIVLNQCDRSMPETYSQEESKGIFSLFQNKSNRVIKTVAIKNKGIPELAHCIQTLYEEFVINQLFEKKRQTRSLSHLNAILNNEWNIRINHFFKEKTDTSFIDVMIKQNPYTLAEEIIPEIFHH